MTITLTVSLAAAAAAALLNIWLAVRIGQVRHAENISLGDGGNPRLLARMRAHANFAEFVPFILVLIVVVELADGATPWLWAAAALTVVGRICHGIGMDGWRAGRAIGVVLTQLVLIGLALYAAYLPFRSAPAAPPVSEIEAPRG